MKRQAMLNWIIISIIVFGVMPRVEAMWVEPASPKRLNNAEIAGWKHAVNVSKSTAVSEIEITHTLPALQATPIYVDHDAPGPMHNGSSWAEAFLTLQEALAIAQAGDEIWVAEGVYYPGTTISDTFELTSTIAIYGGFAGSETARDQRNWRVHPTILSGDIDQNDINTDGNFIAETWNDIVGSNAYHVISNIRQSATILDGFIVTAGQAHGDSPNNVGGGMFSLGSDNITLSNVAFIGNWSSLHGGGIANYYSNLTLVNVFFSGNYSPQGGGLYNEGGDFLLTNVVFNRNEASGGGGIYNEGGNIALTNVTLSYNEADSGGGLYNIYTSTFTMTNTIVWGNLALTDPQIYNHPSTTAIVAYSDVELPNGVYPGTGNINNDPLFVDAINGDLHLQAGSPAIDAGDNGAVAVPTDLDGNSRIIGNAVDMGAYEWSAAVHLMAVVAFDNNLCPHLSDVLERMRLGTLSNSTVHATLLADCNQFSDTRVLEVANGVVTQNDVPAFTGELDTADPKVLGGFLTWARAQRPTDRAVVALLGHGAGLMPEIHSVRPLEMMGIFSQLPLPIGRDPTPMDGHSGTYLSTPELGRALLAATNDGTNPFDVLFLDGCFYGSLDILYEIHQTSNVIVASPNYAWAAFAYDRYLPHFTPTAAPEEIAQAIVDEYEAALDETHPNAIFWVRAGDVAAIADALNGLGEALQSALSGQPSAVNDILAAALAAQFADTTLCADDWQLCPPDEQVGLRSFAVQLQAYFAPGSDVHTEAGNVLTALNGVHSNTTNTAGNPWFKPEVHWDLSDVGPTIIAPLTPTLALTPDVVWRASLYTPTAPLTATLVWLPTQTVVITKPWASTFGSGWATFLSDWYGPITPTVRGWCNILPPALVITGTESLTLTVQGALDSTRLSWTPVVTSAAVDYAVYTLWPGGGTWELAAVVPLTQTTFTPSNLPSGVHLYFVIARNAQAQVVARSNEASVDVGIFTLYVPLLLRADD